MKVFVYTHEGVRELRGGGIEGDAAVDIHRDVQPGDAFGGLSYDELVDGTYEFNTETGRLTRVSD